MDFRSFVIANWLATWFVCEEPLKRHRNSGLRGEFNNARLGVSGYGTD